MTDISDFVINPHTDRPDLLATYKIDLDELVEKVRLLAARNANKRAVCQYVKDGCPECIIGLALHQLGVPLKILNFVQSTHIDNPWRDDHTIQYLAGHTFMTVTDPRIIWLDKVQLNQDLCDRWSEAVSKADRERPIEFV